VRLLSLGSLSPRRHRSPSPTLCVPAQTHRGGEHERGWDPPARIQLEPSKIKGGVEEVTSVCGAAKDLTESEKSPTETSIIHVQFLSFSRAFENLGPTDGFFPEPWNGVYRRKSPDCLRNRYGIRRRGGSFARLLLLEARSESRSASSPPQLAWRACAGSAFPPAMLGANGRRPSAALSCTNALHNRLPLRSDRFVENFDHAKFPGTLEFVPA
jgi:hypothetical protein